jgi:hypothetical protein
MRQLSRDQVLALLTAHPDTWELSHVPDWLAEECADLGLIEQSRLGVWKLMEAGYAEWRWRARVR